MASGTCLPALLLLLTTPSDDARRWPPWRAYCCCPTGMTWDGGSLLTGRCVPCRADGLMHAGQPCFEECGDRVKCDFCGSRGKCCRSGRPTDARVSETTDSPNGTIAYGTDDHICYAHEGGFNHHVCVGSAPAGLEHEGVECFTRCQQRSGSCPFCGPSGRCCRKGPQEDTDDGGDGACTEEEGGVDRHVCIGPPSVPHSCDSPEVILSSSNWMFCQANSYECSLRDDHEGCCCEHGFHLVGGICVPCLAGFGMPCTDQLEFQTFVNSTTIDLECHPSRHLRPCTPTWDGSRGLRFIAFYCGVALCCVTGCLGVVSAELRLRLRWFGHHLHEGRDERYWLQIDDRVVCLATAPGRFEEGDRGTIKSLQGTQAFVELDKCAGADPVPIAQFCIKKEEEEVRPQRRVGAVRRQHVEELLQRLFQLHDLNGDGALQEEELVKLNEKIAMIHYGKDVDRGPVKAKFHALFRAKLDASGHAVLYPTFRGFMLGVLRDIDPDDEEAQEMILEQFIAEAELGREAFNFNSMASESDAPFLKHLS